MKNTMTYAGYTASPDVIEKYLVCLGDILFSHINSDPHLGKTGIASQDTENLLNWMNLLLIRSNPEVLDPWFLNSLFLWYREKGNLYRDLFQSSDATILSSLEQKTANHERKRAFLQDLFHTLLHELMTAKTRVDKIKMEKECA